MVNTVENGLVRGWATEAGAPAAFFVLVDGLQVAELHAALPRPEVAAAGLGPERCGFELALPATLLDGATHRMEFRDRLRRPVLMQVGGRTAESCSFAHHWRPAIRSFVDGWRGGSFEGWVLQSQPDGDRWVGDGLVRVECNGLPIGHARANRYRADVAKSFASDAYCGFQFVPPDWARRAHVQEFHFYALPDGQELQNSPVLTSLVTDQNEALILELADTVDRMHGELTKVRRRIRDLLPKPGFNLGSYDGWYRAYAPALRAHVLATRDAAAPAPLVSIVCPVFRPSLPEFEAALASVRAQTHTNWELLLVDDGSRDPALTALIQRHAAADPRIHPLPKRKNGGIAAATNTAIAAARGDWVAFLDHDDLLADVALEVMLRAAGQGAGQGGRLFYSDEDKIDPTGLYSDPAFKPAWNHRLALEVNYPCHFLMVQRETLAAVGPLDPALDGAQDHDLILRLAERLPPEQIVHVPAVLYHWRRSGQSTAADGAAKPYAVAAGQAAVAAHLARQGLPARVTSRRDTTAYRIDWRFTQEPPVTLIIPFKDEIATTRRCLRTVLEGTAYRAYDVILVDNWSTAPDLAAFAEEVAAEPRVRILRVEEAFNYARLNNLAAAATGAEFLMFMNNDLFTAGPHWLRTLVNEALADPLVAIVGGKFLYPNRTVQHGGVVLGVGGVACHVGTGLGEADPGYGRRLEFAQEYSAVTAAGMLMRAAAFHAVGGFDAQALHVAFNDVDLCLKARAAGWKVVWTPEFVAEHHESLSRGDDIRPVQENRFFHEMQTMLERWGATLTSDPFYHPCLSMERQAFFELLDPALAAKTAPARRSLFSLPLPLGEGRGEGATHERLAKTVPPAPHPTLSQGERAFKRKKNAKTPPPSGRPRPGASTRNRD